MRPGSVAVQSGLWAGTLPGGLEIQGIAGIEVPLWPRLSAVAWGGLQRHTDGSLDPRDATLAALWLPVSSPRLTVRLRPGLSIPTGGIGSGLYFTPLSTASVDPWLSADGVYGEAWLASASLIGRIPLYDGWDRRRQGPFLRGDLRGARRLGFGVAFLGLSAVRQAPSDPVGSVPDFSELAATAGGVANLSERWSATVQLRLPLWASAEATRQLSGGLGLRAVIDPRGGAGASGGPGEHASSRVAPPRVMSWASSRR